MKENKIKACSRKSYRRRLSREVIRKLASRFKVSQQSLNRPYQLVSAKAKERVDPPGQRQRGAAKMKKRPKIERKDTAIVEFLKNRTGKATVAKLKNGRVITAEDAQTSQSQTPPIQTPQTAPSPNR
jgi:hypothetical protein